MVFFSIKLHYSQMLWFRHLGGDVLDAFPRSYYLLIKRKDVLSQAISHSLAAQSGVWLGSEIPANKVEYNYSDIEDELKAILKHNAVW